MQAELDECAAYPYQKIKWRSPHDPQIRILIIEPATDPSTPIVCRLVASYMKDLPSYEALSYTWGDSDDAVAISVETQEVFVTRNLYEALKACRLPAAARRLWVDAICINQGDNREKSETVRHMHIYYRCAMRTITWLGQATKDSDLALDIVRRLGEDRRSAERKQELALLASISDERPSQETITRWIALSNLFGRSYWTRTWVVQEIAYSLNGIVKCGEREVPVHWFFQTCNLLSHSTKSGKTASIDIETYMRLRGMKTVLTMGMLRLRVDRAVDKGNLQGRALRPLGTILSLLRESKSTDPRDKVYGCLMLASRSTGLDQIDVDYDQGCGELYAKVARSLIEQDTSLRVLSSCDTFEQEGQVGDIGESLTLVDGLKRMQIPGLPSWAPNWAIRRISMGFIGDYEEPFDLELLDMDKSRTMPEPYRASGDLDAEFMFSDDCTSLTVKGLVLDGIIDRSEDPSGKNLGEYLSEAANICERSPNAGGMYHLKPWDALLLTLTKNRDASGRRRSAEDQAVLFRGWSLAGAKLATIRGTSTGVKAFFTTCNGYMGLGPLGTKVNDKVCLIKGCFVPMVLRPVKIVDGVEEKDSKNVTHAETSFYRVIGPAYVHGVMEGELAINLERDNLSDFVLR